jgi:hypothetical protein
MDRTFITFPGTFGAITSLLERPSLAETAPHTRELAAEAPRPRARRPPASPAGAMLVLRPGCAALPMALQWQTLGARALPGTVREPVPPGRPAIAGASSGSDSLRRRASVEPCQRKGSGMAPSLACQCGLDPSPERRLADAPTCQRRSPRLRVHPRSGARSRDDGHRRRLRHVPRGLGQRLGRPIGVSVGPACRRRVDSEKPQPPRTGMKRP